MEEEREEVVLEEIWRKIPGYEGLYDASNLGRVMRVTGERGTSVGKILIPGISGSGYFHVSLCKNGRKSTTTIHYIVMTAFVGPRHNGEVVNHKDGNKTNNRLDNLEYVTQSENNRHAFTTGLKSNKGENHSQNKLKEKDIHEIRPLIGIKTQREIAMQFNVTRQTISDIANGRSWSWLKEPDDLTNAKKCV